MGTNEKNGASQMVNAGSWWPNLDTLIFTEGKTMLLENACGIVTS
jgi:hypothetical protein